MEQPAPRSPLLPDRHPIQDFFICDVADAIPKDDMGSMEHPIFSLATKPDVNIREYDHNGVKIAVAPSAYGLATIHDKDVLIYCISQLIAKMNADEPTVDRIDVASFESSEAMQAWVGQKAPAFLGSPVLLLPPPRSAA